MKKRMIMLGGLVILGIMLAIAGNTLGAGELIHDAINKITGTTKVVVEGNNATIYEDGTIIGKVELREIKEGGDSNNPENTPYGHYIDLLMPNMTKEKWLEENLNSERRMNETMKTCETMNNKTFEIAKKDGRVKELIEGKEYKLLGSGTAIVYKTDNNKSYELRLDTLLIEVDGKEYEITIDTNGEKVLSINEVDKNSLHDMIISFNDTTENQSGPYADNCTETDERVIALFEAAKNDSRVKELIEGKNYRMYGSGVHAGIEGDKLVRILSIDINVEGKEYVIVMDVDSKNVLFVGEVDKLKEDLLKIAKNDARLQKIIEEKDYVIKNAEITSENKAQLRLVESGSEYEMPCLIEIDLSNNTVFGVAGSCSDK